MDVEAAQTQSQTPPTPGEAIKIYRGKFFQGFAATSFILNLVALGLFPTIAMFVCAIVAVFIAPVVVFRQRTLDELDGLRKVQNNLRADVNKIIIENERITKNVTELETQVDRLTETEDKLNSIAAEQGKDIDYLTKLVQDHGKIIIAQREATQEQLIQSMTAQLMQSDMDKSSDLSDMEIELLLNIFKNTQSIAVNEKLFREKIARNNSITNALCLIKDLDDDDDNIPHKERVFTWINSSTTNASSKESLGRNDTTNADLDEE